MKKLLLFTAGIALAISSSAQKLALYEEFTGETCGPCAATNPGFDALAITAANASKILVIKYQVPIPTAGTGLYPQAKVYADARDAYYSISSAPSGIHDGLVPTTGSHPASFTQAAIDAEAAVASPFNVTVTAAWDATYTNILATITVKATAAYTGSGSVYLRTAIVQDVDFCTAPGSNGETHFSHVVRSMYPDATGTGVAATWTAGTTQTYNYTIPVPNYVDKSTAPFLAVWIQSDGDKKIAQAARSAALPATPSDLTFSGCPKSSLSCVTGTTGGSVAHSVVLKNKGTTTATAADIYFKAGSGAYTKYSWTGSIAAGATASVTLPATTVTTAGEVIFTDSIYFAADNNQGNNKTTSSVTVASTSPKALPYSTDFEVPSSGFPAGFYGYDSDGSGSAWLNGSGGAGSTYCHSGVFMPWFKLSSFATGASSVLIVPTPAISGNVAIDFWEAYAQNAASNTDKLEVVYSTNCGTSWITVWSAVGTAHATTAPTTTYWLPDRSATPSGWVKRSVSISSLPAGALLGFRATDGGGNNLFLDDVNVRTVPTGIKEENMLNSFSVNPNPATEFTNINFNITEATNVNVFVVDALGKTVINAANEQMTAGTHEMKINTSSLSTGMYMIKIATANGVTTEKLSVIK